MKNKDDKKTALISGGAQGIGRGIAEKFLRFGYKVAMADIDTEAGSEMMKKYDNLLFIPCDGSKEKDVKKTIERVKDEFSFLSVLINNLGGARFGTPIVKLSLKKWTQTINLNLTSAFLFCKYAIPLMSKGSSVINISSTRALQSEKNTEAYSAAKGGILALTHALAISLAPDIRVNCISPGWIRTDGWRKKSENKIIEYSEADHSQHPSGKIGTPEDIANLAYFLASDDAGFITGQNFVADGGMTKKMIYV